MRKTNGHSTLILIVDDNPRAAQIIRDLLIHHGYHNSVICSSIFAASSEIVKQAQEVIIITSYDLLNANGVQLIEKLSEIKPNLKGIITTYEAKRVQNNTTKYPILEKSDSGFFQKMRDHIDAYLCCDT